MELNFLNTAQFHTAQAKTAEAARAIDAAKAPTTKREIAARQAAESFEALIIAQMLAPMFSTVATDGEFGGGHSEAIFRGFMVDEIGKSVARGGGIGIADSVYRELLAAQEV